MEDQLKVENGDTTDLQDEINSHKRATMIFNFLESMVKSFKPESVHQNPLKNVKLDNAEML